MVMCCEKICVRKYVFNGILGIFVTKVLADLGDENSFADENFSRHFETTVDISFRRYRLLSKLDISKRQLIYHFKTIEGAVASFKMTVFYNFKETVI